MRKRPTEIIHCSNGRMLIGKDVPEATARHAILQKMLATVQVTDSGCWQWIGWCNPTWGYGETCFKGKNWRVHRLMWTLTKGEIPEGYVIRHKCDNPPCCNPDHLVIGTDAENVDDRMSRGRDHHSQLTHCPHGHPYAGENLWVDSRGFRHCRECQRIKGRDPKYVAWRREYQRKRRALKRAEKLTASRTI